MSLNHKEQEALANKIFIEVALELRNWREARHMFDGFDDEAEAEFRRELVRTILEVLVKEEAK